MTEANTTAPQANTAVSPPPAPSVAPKPAIVSKAVSEAPGVVHGRDFHVRHMDKNSPNRNPDGTVKVVYPIVRDGKQ